MSGTFSETKRYIPLASYDSRLNAEIMRSMLKAQLVDVYIDESAGIKLMVYSRDYAKAKELLKNAAN